MKTLAFIGLLFAQLFRPDLDKPGITIECNGDGSAKATVPHGTYELIVTDGKAFMCYAPTCSTGGDPRPAGNHGLVLIQRNTDVSCRSFEGATVFFRPGTRL